MFNISIIGSSGTIGNAFINQLSHAYPQAKISGFSRTTEVKSFRNVSFYEINYTDEASIAKCAEIASMEGALDLVIVATGILHDKDIEPEKSINDITINKLQQLFLVNTIFPALVAKHFLPKIAKDRRAVFAALSARIGSISDNRLGGWYSYRASKAALNMLIKNLSIEIKMRHKEVIIVGLHPGTVESKLSKKFLNNIPAAQIFKPDYAVDKLITVLENLNISDTGKCFAWNGKEILP